MSSKPTLSDVQTVAFAEPKSQLRMASLAGLFGTAAITGAGAFAGFWTAQGPHGTIVVWPLNAIFLCILLRVAEAQRGLYLAAGFAGVMLGALAAGDSPLISAALALFSVLEVVLGLLLTSRLGRTIAEFTSAEKLLKFCLFVGVLVPLIGSSLTSLVVCAQNHADFLLTWRTWALADSLGYIILTPAVLSTSLREFRAIAERGRKLEFALLLTLLVAVTVSLSTQNALTRPWVIMPCLMLIALRLGFNATALGIVAVAFVSSVLTMTGHGTFALLAGATHTGEILLLQAFLLVIALTTLPASAALRQRDRYALQLGEQNRLLLLAEQVGRIGHWRLEVEESVLYCSESLFDIFGLTMGKHRPSLSGFLGMCAPEDRGSMRDLFADAIAGGVDFERTISVMRWDKTRRSLYVRAVCELDAVGETRALFGVMHDVTDFREQKEALVRANALQKGIFESSDYAIYTTDLAGMITSINPAAEHMVGHESRDLIGKMTPALFHDPSELEARAKAVAEKLGHDIQPGVDVFVSDMVNGVEEREWTYVRSDGRRLPVLVTITTLRDGSGNAFGYMAVLKDITVRKALEESLRSARDSAESAARMKSEFVAMLSHELRTPMTGVLGVIDLLKTEPPDEERRDLLATLDTSAHTLMSLLGDILDFSKIEAGHLSLEVIDFSVHDLLAGVMHLYKKTAEAKGVTLRLLDNHGLEVDAVQGDPTRLRQILSNLVSNAIKFTPKGWVELGATASIDDNNCARWIFEVKDSGIGIDAGALAKLFTAFTQADTSTTRRFGGTGLGLAISKRLAEAMGATIEVESVPGGGSTFRLTIVFPRAATLQKESTEDIWHKRAIALRVLVAEDNIVNQKIIRSMLRRMGHICVCVDNGYVALDFVQREPFDVVLMDMHMPVMDGPTAVRRIRALASTASKIPIIALTADVIAEHRDLFTELGLNGFVPKPIEPARLARALDDVAEEMKLTVPLPSYAAT
jgi:PAS domain S-box-containing protein